MTATKASLAAAVVTRYVGLFHRCRLDAFDNLDSDCEGCWDCVYGAGPGFLVLTSAGVYAFSESGVAKYPTLKDALDALDCIADEVIPMRAPDNTRYAFADCLAAWAADKHWDPGYDASRFVCTL